MSTKNLLQWSGSIVIALCIAGAIMFNLDQNRILEGQMVEGTVVEHGSDTRLPNLWLQPCVSVANERYEIIDEAGIRRGRPIVRPRTTRYTRIRNSSGDWFVAGHVGIVGEHCLEYSAWHWPP